jgi:transposase
VHRCWRTASREDLLAELERLERENERQRTELERAERERDRFRRDSEWLRKKVKDLEQKLDAVERARFRQAAPFSRGVIAAAPKRPGRKAGAAYGRHARRPIPARIDVHLDAALPAACPTCEGRLRETHVALQYQEDLPVVRPIVRAFHVHIGRCTSCGRRVQGRHPLQTSDALGAAAAQVGPHTLALATVLNKQLGLSLGKVTTLLRERFGLSLTCGGLVHGLRRVARRATPTYEALLAQVRGSPVVAPDETGWKVAGQLHWLWAFATPDTTVYAIQRGRGFEEAGWAPTLTAPSCATAGRRTGHSRRRSTSRVSRTSCAAVARSNAITTTIGSLRRSRPSSSAGCRCAIAGGRAPSPITASPLPAASSTRGC